MAESQHGARVGTRIAMLVSKAIVATHVKLVATKHKLAMMVFRSISDEISAEVDDVFGHIYKQVLEHHGEDGTMAPLLKFMHESHGQLKAIAGAQVASQSLLWSITAILNDVLAPTVYFAVENSPHLIPDAPTIAQLAATGRWGHDTALSDLAKNGYNNTWSEALIDVQRQYLDTSSLLDLYRRGEIKASEFDAQNLKSGIPQSVSVQLRKLANVPLSPADAALAVLRGNMSHADGESTAALWGVSSATFAQLIGNTGEPLGLEQLLEARRRGFIDEATLRRGILQSRVRNEWIGTAEKLAYSPISVADAVNAVVQGHLDAAKAEEYARFNGLEPGMTPLLIETAGEPLSRTEMEQLYNRGLATKADVDQALRESRLKNKYNTKAFELHERLPEPRMLSSAVETGSITRGAALKIALDYGYSHENATVIVDEAHQRKLLTYRQGIIRSVETLYEDNAISRPAAETTMKSLKFEQDEIANILKAAEYRRESKMLATVISAIRGKYLAHHITASAASGYLDKAGVPATQRDELLNLWGIEHGAFVRELTPAQVIKAHKLELLSDQETLNRLINMGYSKEDAALLILGA